MCIYMWSFCQICRRGLNWWVFSTPLYICGCCNYFFCFVFIFLIHFHLKKQKKNKTLPLSLLVFVLYVSMALFWVQSMVPKRSLVFSKDASCCCCLCWLITSKTMYMLWYLIISPHAHVYVIFIHGAVRF